MAMKGSANILLIFCAFASLQGSTAMLNQHKQAVQSRSTLVIIYMAARNDLFPFAGRHVKQLQAIGASDQTKIFVRLDIQKPGKDSITKHFFVEKDKIMHVGQDSNLDSGDAQSFIDTVKTAYTHFPAENVVLILWGHGTGPVEPSLYRSLRAHELFRYNQSTSTYELDRSTGYLDAISGGETSYAHPKGICFDDASGTYLTTTQLTDALKTISRDIIKKKFTILACDSCLMAGIDVFGSLKDSVHYFVGSQEVELGAGYNYGQLVEPLVAGQLQCNDQFACHMVNAYKETYGDLIDYYTHCAIDLTHIDILENKLDELARIMIWGLENQSEKSVKAMLRLSRHKNHCTRFNEPTFLDMHHLLRNIQKNVPVCILNTPQNSARFKNEVGRLTQEAVELIEQSVIAHTEGNKHRRAHGISIYFPEYVIHKSYYNNGFATRTHWLKFLQTFLEI